jgi:hypothetical protein
MYPITPGTSDDFWSCYLLTSPSGKPHRPSGSAFIEEGYACYAPVSMDSVWSYRVPLDEAMKHFPTVLERLEQQAADPNNTSIAAEGYRRWKALPAERQRGHEGLAAAIDDAHIASLLKVDILGVGWFHHYHHAELRKQVERAHHYWANFVFELLFFCALIWFILWPALKNGGFWRWLLHLSITPFLFIFPSWLGYCGVNNIGGIGPAGGILYPYFTFFFPRLDGLYYWEIAFVRALPKFLEPINQTHYDMKMTLSPPWQISASFIGPFEILLISASIAVLMLFTKYLSLRFAKYRLTHQPRGFEVIAPHSTLTK